MTKPANSKQLVHVTVSTAVVAAVDLIAAQQLHHEIRVHQKGRNSRSRNPRAAVLFGRLLPSFAKAMVVPHAARLLRGSPFGDQRGAEGIRPNLVTTNQ